MFHIALDNFLAAVLAKSKDGLTLEEIGSLFTEFLQMAVQLAAELSAPGAKKKELVMRAVESLFDALVPVLPWPKWACLLRPILTPSIRKIVLALADGAIEAIYAKWWRQGA